MAVAPSSCAGRAGFGPPATVVLVAAACLVVASRWMGDLAQLVVLASVQAGSGLAGLVALRRRGQLRAPLAAFGAAWVLFGIGVGCWWWYEAVLHRPFLYPGLPDLFFVPAYVALAAGIWLAIRCRSPGFEVAAVLDSMILAAGVAYFNWTLLTEPALDGAPFGSAQLITVVYPLIDVVTVALVVRLLLLGRRSGAVWLLAASALANFAGDQTYAALARFGHYSTGAAPDQLWMLGALLFVAAALHPRVVDVDAPGARTPAGFGGLRLGFMALAMQLPVLVLGVRWLNGDRIDATATAILLAVLLPLATIRTCGLVRRLHRLSVADELTGLATRREIVRELQQRRANAAPGASVLFIDLDRFKKVNDTLGHAAGDAVLSQVAVRIRSLIRHEDVVARVGGDEFAVLVAHGGGPAAIALAERLVAELGRPFVVEGRELFLGCSVGVADLADDGELPLRNADLAMYAAKAAGRSSWAAYTPSMASNAAEEMGIEAGLRRAVGGGELRLWYQPVVDTQSGRTCGLEALVRWEHPELGLLPPAAFIEIAERTGSMTALGDWVLTRAMRDGASWNATRRAHPLRVAVNVSARQIAHPAYLLASIDRSLELTGFDPSLLEIEVTETAVLGDVDQAAWVVAGLRARGISTAIDDFGTGFSSLSHLRRLQVDIIKIDRTFVAGIGRRLEDTTIVAAVLGLASAMGMAVVAEGVETEEQLTILHDMGCDMVQGFHLSRPLPAADVLATLDREWFAEHPSLRELAASERAAAPPDGAQQRYRAIIADDSPDDRLLHRRELEATGRFVVVAEAADGVSAIELSALHQPHLVVLDLRMPGTDGLSALPRILLAAPGTRVVLVSGHSSPGAVDRALAIGAAAFHRKGVRGLGHELVSLLDADPAPSQSRGSLS